VNSGQVTALISADKLLLAGRPIVTVFNPLPGGGLSNSVNFNITGTAPGTPAHIRLAAATVDSVIIAWDDSNIETGYKVYKWDSLAAQWKYYTSLAANVTSFIDKQLTCGEEYSYKVSAFNSNGESAPTLPLVAGTGACPPVSGDDFDNPVVVSYESGAVQFSNLRAVTLSGLALLPSWAAF
jgi:hypothetical protein